MTFEEFAKKYAVEIETATPLRSRPDSSFDRADQSHFSLLLTMDNPPNHRAIGARIGLWRGNYSLGFGHAESWAKKNKLAFMGDHRVTDYLRNPLPWGKSHLPDSYYCQTVKARYEKRVEVAHNRETNAKRHKPFTPLISAAEILCSLQMDISGADQKFEDWVQDFGYDSDSRKAYGIWETVNNIRRDLEAVFTIAQMQEFMECEE